MGASEPLAPTPNPPPPPPRPVTHTHLISRSFWKSEYPFCTTTVSTSASYPRSMVIQAARLAPDTTWEHIVLAMLPLTTCGGRTGAARRGHCWAGCM